jgi:hypothetical protein
LPRALINRGTVFIRRGLLEELSGITLETEFFDSWLLVPDGMAEEVKRRARGPSRSLFSERPIEASAFGCDSGVLDRAVSRALQKARDQALDFVEIMEIEGREDSGLDYVSILARAVRIPVDSAANLAASGALIRTEGKPPQ